jgi:hypothetical protein
MTERKATPRRIEKELYKAANSRCCRCGEGDIDKLTIHHIVPVELNPNHEPRHMLVLCANCHSLATAGKIDPEELYSIKYRADQQNTASPPQPASASVSISGDGNIVAGRDINIAPKVVRRTAIVPGPQHVNEEQAFRIKELVNGLAGVDELAGRGRTFDRWYAKLYRHFRVTSYKLIPAERGEEAIAWLQKQKAVKRPQLRRTNNPEWRKSIYQAIWARTKQLAMDKQNVYDLALTRLGLKEPVLSLTELGERNLSKLRDIIFKL